MKQNIALQLIIRERFKDMYETKYLEMNSFSAADNSYFRFSILKVDYCNIQYKVQVNKLTNF